MQLKTEKIGGLLFFLAGGLILLGILTAEIFYPGNYSISLDMISTLGASPPPDSVIKEPSAQIFDYSMMISGFLIITGSILDKSRKNEVFNLVMFLFGAGALGVGVFPAFHSVLHPIVALTTFLFGGIAALLSSRISKPPFAFIEIILGTILLVFLGMGIFASDLIVPYLGRGGTERWIAYPLIVWLLGFGSMLMSKNK